MTGKLNNARNNFIKAMLLFKKTKDPRGIVYCRLGLGEIALLKGRKAAARRHFLASLYGSTKNSFAVEKCHARTLTACMNFGGGFSGKIDDGCYNRLGLKLGFQVLPFNIP
jgi:hypothetical protein